MSEDLNSEEIWDAVTDEVAYRAMTAPTPVASLEELDDCVVSRRFMVEQINEKTVSRYRRSDRLTT